jgi:mannosyltransferase
MSEDGAAPAHSAGPTRHAAPSARQVSWPEATVTVAALLVFGWRVGAASPWRDEAATMAACRRGLGQLLAMTRHIDLVHLAFYLLARGALAVQDSVTAVRLVSVVMTALAAGALTALGRRLAGSELGLVAGAVFVVMPVVSRWAQDARSIALVTLLATVATGLLLTAAGTPRRRGPWAGYAGVVVLLGLVNVLGLLILPAHALFLALTHAGRTLGRALAAGAAATVVLMPWLMVTFGQRAQVAWIEPPHLYDLTALYIHAFGSKLVPPVVVLGAVVTLVLCRGVPGGGAGQAFVLGAAWASVPPVLLWTVSLWLPMWDAHYVFFAMPGLALLIAAEIATIAPALLRGSRPAPLQDTRAAAARAGPARPARRGQPRGSAVAAGFVVCLIGMIGAPDQLAYRSSAGHDEDLRAAADYLARHALPGDGVLFVPADLRDIRATYPGAFAGLDDLALAQTPIDSDTLHGVEAVPADLPRRIAGRPRIWLITGDVVVPSPAEAPQDAAKLAALARGYRLAGRVDVPAFRILRYEPDRAP